MDEQKLQSLLAAPECRYDFRGQWKAMSKAEEDNWWARQELVSSLRRPVELTSQPETPRPAKNSAPALIDPFDCTV